MNILWIEDFGGGLDTGTQTLNLLFQDLLSFDNWDEDERSLLSSPADLQNYCQDNSALHCIYLCRHYFDYEDFKDNNDLMKKIDLVIIDIRLDNQVDFDRGIPISSLDKNKFHTEAGFYIFNDLVHFEFPVEKMCFMTGETNSLNEFSTKCDQIYMPRVCGFEKSDAGYQKLRCWINNQAIYYCILRRGIIEACEYLKDKKIRFCQYSADDKKQAELDVENYLEILQVFLPLRKPDDTMAMYKLFVRTLAHEWDEAVKPKKLDKQQVTLAFSWIMKIARNWSAHTRVFDRLRAQDVAYLFIINMRAMFDLGGDSALYEKHLFSLFDGALETDKFKEVFGTSFRDRKIPLAQKYALLIDKYGKNYEANSFHDLLNEFQKKKSGNDDFLMQGLYQVFWFLTSYGHVYVDPHRIQDQKYLNYQFAYFNYGAEEYLVEIGRHIYNSSFTSD